MVNNEAENPMVQPVQPTRAYFTREVNNLIADMTDQEMLQELQKVEQTRAWIAILKYNQVRLQHSQTAIISGDPFKDPTGMARNQGIMLGLCDLQNAVILLKWEKEEASKQEAEEKSA